MRQANEVVSMLLATSLRTHYDMKSTCNFIIASYQQQLIHIHIMTTIHLYIYTGWSKKVIHCIVDGNFVKCWKIFIFFTVRKLTKFPERYACNIFHHTFKMLLLYLAKCETWQKWQTDYRPTSFIIILINHTVKLAKLFEKMFIWALCSW